MSDHGVSGEEFAVMGVDTDGEWIVAEECAARLNGKVVRRTVSKWTEVSR